MYFFDEPVSAQMQDLPLADLFRFLPFGYLLTILIETPVLLAGLPSRLTLRQKLFCGVWLTACTYPVVALVLPAVFFGAPRWQYLAVAEIFAPAAECMLFWIAFKGRIERRELVQSFVAITIANLASFGLGEVLNHFRWFGLF